MPDVSRTKLLLGDIFSMIDCDCEELSFKPKSKDDMAEFQTKDSIGGKI